MFRTPFAPFATLLLAVGPLSHAQNPPTPPPAAPAPAAPKNLVGNGGFETGFRRESLWDGVDSAGYLSGERGALPVLTASGAIAESAMPLSVSIADMNNDGLLDLVTMDVLGYCRVFFNTGTPQAPAFETGDLANFFLSRVAPNDPISGGIANPNPFRRGPRVHATEMFKTGKRDLLIGNYFGELLVLMNAGSIQVPDFRQPPDVGRTALPTSKDATSRWGNLFSPTTWDWNNDGREDLLVGEGSYSANNIHLLVNTVGGSKPTFDESSRHVLAFGDGLEQLSPAVVDYNGDGTPDLLVSERSGKVALYLNKGTPWKSGDPLPELPFASFVNTAAGSPISFGGIASIAVGDLDGNGLFDLVAGKSNGRIAVAYNKGTKDEPKFDAPVELKGKAGTPAMSLPSGWEVDYGLERGNFLGYTTVVKNTEDPQLQPPEGISAFRASYYPSHNKIMPPPSFYSGAFGAFNPVSADSLRDAPARFFQIRQAGRFRLKVGKTYTLSFKTRGRASDCVAVLHYVGEKEVGQERITRGDRDSVVRQTNRAREEKRETMTFSPGAAWTAASKDIRVQFSNRELSDLEQTNTASLEIGFTIPQGGELYLDEVSLIEKQ